MVIAGVIGFVVLVIVCVFLYIFRCEVFGTDCPTDVKIPEGKYYSDCSLTSLPRFLEDENYSRDLLKYI